MFGLFKPSWEKNLKRAEKAQASGLWVDAHHYYSDALRDAPDDHETAIKEALNLCATTLFDAHSLAAEEFEEKGDQHSALERWELAERFSPTEEGKELARKKIREMAAAKLVDEEKEWDKEEVLETAKLDEEHVFLMLIGDFEDRIGDAYQELGDDFREAYLTQNDGHPENALPIYDRLVETDEDPILHYERAQCLRALDRAAEARVSLEAAEALDGEWIDIKLALASACWATKDWDAAEAVLQRAIDLETEDLRVYEYVARSAFLTQQPDYGLDALDVILAKEPTNIGAHLLKGKLHVLDEEYDVALTSFELVINATWSFDEQLRAVVFNREAGMLAARIYLDQKRKLDRAEELIRAALVVTPPTQRWVYELLLGQVHDASGDKPKAIEIWERVALEVPEDQVLGRLRVAELLGRTKEAQDLKSGLTEAQQEELSMARTMFG